MLRDFRLTYQTVFTNEFYAVFTELLHTTFENPGINCLKARSFFALLSSRGLSATASIVSARLVGLFLLSLPPVFSVNPCELFHYKRIIMDFQVSVIAKSESSHGTEKQRTVEVSIYNSYSDRNRQGRQKSLQQQIIYSPCYPPRLVPLTQNSTIGEK